jgi:excisionase family DNA binding protein
VTDGYTIDLTDALDRLREELRAELLAELRAERDNSGPAFMNVSEAATYLGVTPGRVRKLVSSHTVAFHQESPGARVLFARADLDEYMRGQRVEARRGDLC